MALGKPPVKNPRTPLSARNGLANSLLKGLGRGPNSSPRLKAALRRFAAAGLALGLAGCGSADDFLFVRNKGADMPVWVRGNTASGTIVVFLHGGPGGNSLLNTDRAVFRNLEQAFGVAYWDQRASGSSRGQATPETLTLDQFAEDLDGVVEALRQRHPGRRLVLLGYSWGGAVGSAYLLNPSRQAKIAGWIELDGAHSVRDGNRLSMAWVKEQAAAQIAAGKKIDHWREALAWYERTPSLSVETFPTHQRYVSELEDSLAPPKNSVGAGSAGLNFFGPFSGPSMLSNSGYVTAHMTLTPAFLDTHLTPQLSAITLPSLVLWGRLDGRLPVALATEAFERLGTPAERKSLHIFEHSAHTAYIDEPDAFAEAVKGFVGTL